MKARLNLIVLRASDPDRLAAFYSALGLIFEKHRHGTGPEHFACENDGLVFEIYPSSTKNPPTQNLRIGFQVTDVSAATDQLLKLGAKQLSAPSPSPWGLRAVLQDLEGNKVELTEAVG